MNKVNIIREDYTNRNGKPCVYRIWFNDYYYIGTTSNLEKRLSNHFGFVKRFYTTKPMNWREKRVYRKLIPVLNAKVTLNIRVEIVLDDRPLQELLSYERSLHYENHNCPHMINSVKKKIA